MIFSIFIYEQVVQFSTQHLLTIAICFALIALFPVLGNMLSANHRIFVELSVVAFGLLQEVVDYTNRYLVRGLNFSEDLPLHICNIMFYVGLIFMVTKSQFLFELLYLVGLGAAFITILTPEFKMINHIDYILFFFYHGLIVAIALWGVFVNKMKPRKESIRNAYFTLWALTIPVGLVSWIVDGNYMFLMKSPTVSNPLVFGDWPFYVINISVISLIIMFIAFLPFRLSRTDTTRS